MDTSWFLFGSWISKLGHFLVSVWFLVNLVSFVLYDDEYEGTLCLKQSLMMTMEVWKREGMMDTNLMTMREKTL